MLVSLAPLYIVCVVKEVASFPSVHPRSVNLDCNQAYTYFFRPYLPSTQEGDWLKHEWDRSTDHNKFQRGP